MRCAPRASQILEFSRRLFSPHAITFGPAALAAAEKSTHCAQISSLEALKSRVP